MRTADRTTSPAGTIPTGDATESITRRVDGLLAVARDWDLTASTHRTPLALMGLPHTPTVEALSYLDDAATVLAAAERIRDGYGDWRTDVATHLPECDRCGDEDVEIRIAAESAEAAARDVLTRAVEADERDRAAGGRLDAAAVLVSA